MKEKVNLSIEAISSPAIYCHFRSKRPKKALPWIKSLALSEKCTYSEFFWSLFSRNRTEYGPEKLRIRLLFTECDLRWSHSVNTVSEYGMSCVLRNFAKFTGKHQRQSLFFNKVACLRPATLLKNSKCTQVLSC